MGFNTVFYLTHFAQLTNILSKCSVWDSECVTGLAQNYGNQIIRNGIDSETGPLDPMFLGPVALDDGSLRFTWTDAKVLGLRDTIQETVQFNTLDKTFRIRSRVPYLTMLGNYTSEGYIEDVPYFGKGRVLTVHNDFANEMIIKYNVFAGKDGKNYLNLESYSYWFETPNSSNDIEGLNQDDPVKAYRAQVHLNARSQKLWQQYGRNIFNLFNDKIFEALQKFFRTTPVDDILADY